MRDEIKIQIETYLLDEAKLYQDWYTGLNPDKGETYATPVSASDDVDNLKKLFEKWFRQQRDVFKKLCEGYCQKRQQFQNHEPLLIAFVVDSLTPFFAGIPINLLATATILSGEKFLDRLCACSKLESEAET